MFLKISHNLKVDGEDTTPSTAPAAVCVLRNSKMLVQNHVYRQLLEIKYKEIKVVKNKHYCH